MGSKAAVFGDDPVAGSKVAVRIGMESLADAAGVSSAKSASKLTVGCHLTGRNLASESVDLGEETHTMSILYFVDFTTMGDSKNSDIFNIYLINNAVVADS